MRDTFAQRIQGGLSAVRKAQFSEDVGDMGTHGAFADDQLICDFLVCLSQGDLPKDFHLAICQRVLGWFFALLGLDIVH